MINGFKDSGIDFKVGTVRDQNGKIVFLNREDLLIFLQMQADIEGADCPTTTAKVCRMLAETISECK